MFSACGQSADEYPDSPTESPMEHSIIFEEPNSPSHSVLQELLQQQTTVLPEKGDTVPVIALIIDDMGHHQSLGKKLIDLKLNLTFSFLPNAPHTLELAEMAHANGRDILIHLPMEPKGQKWNPGQDALMLKESPAQIQQKTSTLISRVPYAIGVNNHMGSLFTEQQSAMKDVLTVLARHHLFFVDSFTSAQSVGFAQASAMHIPTARRHVFLDNVHQTDKICHQIKQLTHIASQKGSAIGIGHPNTATLNALDQCAPSLLKSVHLVGVHELVQ